MILNLATPKSLLREPLFRLLAINLAIGVTVAALMLGGLLALNPHGLRDLIVADRSPLTALRAPAVRLCRYFRQCGHGHRHHGDRPWRGPRRQAETGLRAGAGQRCAAAWIAGSAYIITARSLAAHSAASTRRSRPLPQEVQYSCKSLLSKLMPARQCRAHRGRPERRGAGVSRQRRRQPRRPHPEGARVRPDMKVVSCAQWGGRPSGLGRKCNITAFAKPKSAA